MTIGTKIKIGVLGACAVAIIGLVGSWYLNGTDEEEVSKPKVESSNQTTSSDSKSEETSKKSSDKEMAPETKKANFCESIKGTYPDFSAIIGENLKDCGDYYELKVEVYSNKKSNTNGTAFGDKIADDTLRFSKNCICHFNSFDAGVQNLTMEGYKNTMGGGVIRLIGPDVVQDADGLITEFNDVDAN